MRQALVLTINQGHALYSAFGGIHHPYANPEAEQGYQSGKFADRAVGSNAAAACFECPTPQKNRYYVFSTFRK